VLHPGGETPRRRGTVHAGKAWIVALLLAAATALAACGGSTGGGSSSTTEGRPGGTIVWAKPAEVPELDPAPATNLSALQLMDEVYEPLVGLDDHLRPAPKLATSWKQISPTAYVFDIRRGVRFSNGREMTVDDVVGSLRRLTDPRLAASWAVQIGPVKRIAAKGDWQVEIVLARPNSSLVPALTGTPAAIMPMKELRDGTLDPRRAMLGTGPFKIVRHVQDESWTLARNPYYWQRGQPLADQVIVRIMTDDAARVAGLKDGSVDVANFDTPDAVQLLAGQPNVKTVTTPTTDFYRLTVNSRTSIFRDKRLRQALALAINRQEISDVALGGTSEPSSAVAPSFGLCKLSDMPFGEQDLARAKQLVEEAGATGKTVGLIASPTYKTLAPIAQVIVPELEQIGLKVKIDQAEQGEWLARVYTGRSDFDLDVSFFGSLVDPPMGLAWWSSAQTWHPWIPVDRTLDALIDKTHVLSPGPARDAAIEAACKRIHENASLIPLVTKPTVAAYRSDKVNADIPDVATSNPVRLATSSVKGG